MHREIPRAVAGAIPRGRATAITTTVNPAVKTVPSETTVWVWAIPAHATREIPVGMVTPAAVAAEFKAAVISTAAATSMVVAIRTAATNKVADNKAVISTAATNKVETSKVVKTRAATNRVATSKAVDSRAEKIRAETNKVARTKAAMKTAAKSSARRNNVVNVGINSA